MFNFCCKAQVKLDKERGKKMNERHSQHSFNCQAHDCRQSRQADGTVSFTSRSIKRLGV